MSDTRKSYAPKTLIGTPTIFIAVIWVSMWMLWPSDVVKQSTKLQPSGMKVHYARYGLGPDVLDPDGMMLKSDAVLALRDDDLVDSDLIMAHHDRPVRYMKRKWSVASPEKIVGILPDAQVGVSKPYSPRWKETPLFKSKGSVKKKLFFEPHSDLAKKGFTMPDSDATLLDSFKASWQMTAYIDASADGVPEHIFVVKSSGDPKVDAIVIRELYKSRLTSSDQRAGGRVTVNWGES